MEEICQQNILDYEEDEQSLLSYKMKLSILNSQPRQQLSTPFIPHNLLQVKEKQKATSTIMSFLYQLDAKDKKSAPKYGMADMCTLDIQGNSLYSQRSSNIHTSELQNRPIRKTKRKSRFFTPPKKINLTYKFVKVIRNNKAMGPIIIQDKCSSIASLNGKGILYISDGTKVNGTWNEGEAVGQLSVSQTQLKGRQIMLHPRRFTFDNTSKFKLERAGPAQAMDWKHSQQLLQVIRRNSDHKKRYSDFLYGH